MIVDAQKIYINGTVYPVYAVDFGNNGSNSPSTLELKFVNQSGVYQHPTKTTSNVTSIKIGNFFNFYGYPVSSTITKSSSGNVLSVKYVDTSIILDKYFIGLKGLHGAGFSTTTDGISKNIILVGEQVDPCDGLPNNFEDPCNPCQSSNVGLTVPGDLVTAEGSEKLFDCEQQKSLQILDVVYKFRDLLNAIQSRITTISFSNVPLFLNDDKYYARHTGTVREVLNQWCQEYNITYIWNNGKIRFIDLKNGLEINDSNVGLDCQIIDISETETIEENSSYGTISYFGLNGELKKQDCGESGEGVTRLSLIPLTIRDILGTATGDGTEIAIDWTNLGYKSIDEATLLSGDEQKKVNFFLALLALGKTSEIARDLFILRYLYNFFAILEADPDALAEKEFPELGITLLKKIDQNDSDLGSILENSPEMNSKALAKKGLKRENFVFYRGYKKDYSKKRYLTFEQQLTDNFIGKYWIRNIVSGTNQYQSPDGSVKVYQSSSEQDSGGFLLDVLNIIPNAWASIVNNFIKTKIVPGEDDPNTELNESQTQATTENIRKEKSAVVLERSGAWSVSSVGKAMESFEDALDSIKAPYMEFDSNKELAQTEIENENKLGYKYQYFCFYKPTAKQLKAIELDTNIVDRPHPFEQKNITVTESNYTTTYGLRSNTCKTFTLNGGKIRFYTPVQCWDYGKNFAGYTVTRKSGSSSTTYLVGLEKQEYVLTKVPPLDDLSLSLKINYRDITQQFVQLLEKGTNKKCQYSLSAIRLLVSDFSRSMFDPPTNPKNKILIRKDYSLSGFPNSFFTIEDGLNSISLRYSSESGWSSQLSFSSLPIGVRSDNLLSKDFERTWIQNYGAKTFQSGVKNIL